MIHLLRYAVVVMLVSGPAVLSADGAQRSKTQIASRTPEPTEPVPYPPSPLSFRDSQLEPIDWNALEGWAADDHANAYGAFLASCRPLSRANPPAAETRPMYFALKDVCARAVKAGRLGPEPARQFFERNFRPLRISKLGDSAGFLTGYYEPVVDGSRFPTPIFKVPIYRRPPDLVPPGNAPGPAFPNRGQSMRRTSGGELVPYYDRGQILDGALDGQHLEIT